MRYMMKKEQGVTLIELMIVLVIAVFLVAGIYSLFITQHRSYTVQDQVAGVQQDARVALDMIARDVRMAGFQIGLGGAISPTNGGANSPDQISINYAMQVATVTDVIDADVYLDDISAFSTTNSVVFEGIRKIYQIQQTPSRGVDPDHKKITLTEDAPTYIHPPDAEHPTSFPGGGRVYLINAVTYSISGVALQRNGQPLAGDGVTTVVEDLQFAYSNDGQNWFNLPPTGSPRLIRISIIVRTAVPDPQDTSFFKPACEDRPRENTFPGCRRRVYTTVVQVRNT
jgi:prepilin-type N-terminal cleavage/methylation domain-containing protein